MNTLLPRLFLSFLSFFAMSICYISSSSAAINASLNRGCEVGQRSSLTVSGGKYPYVVTSTNKLVSVQENNSNPGKNTASYVVDGIKSGNEKLIITDKNRVSTNFSFACGGGPIIDILKDGSVVQGYSDGVGVTNGRWDASGVTKTNRYKGYYAVDSAGDAYFWKITGRAFGRDAGTVSLSDSNLSVANVKWNDTSIQFTVKPKSHAFTYNPNVKVVVATKNGKTADFTVPVIGLINSRGYGQCTWLVAKIRKDNKLAIPGPKAHDTNTAINSSYVPRPLDAIEYGNRVHVAIIRSVSGPTDIKNGTTKIRRYALNIEEMNAKEDEKSSSYKTNFDIYLDNKSNKPTGVEPWKHSNSSRITATGVYR